MPEIITKYPEVVMQVLQGSGAKCGTGEKQKILTHCPPGQFCSLPAGEMCVYGIQDISHMQQVSSTEIFQIIKDELIEIKNKYSDPRRTQIVEEETLVKEEFFDVPEEINRRNRCEKEK